MQRRRDVCQDRLHVALSAPGKAVLLFTQPLNALSKSTAKCIDRVSEIVERYSASLVSELITQALKVT